MGPDGFGITEHSGMSIDTLSQVLAGNYWLLFLYVCCTADQKSIPFGSLFICRFRVIRFLFFVDWSVD